MRSGTVSCSTGVQRARLDAVDRRSVDVPTPSISAPIAIEELAEVDDLRLAGGVVDRRRALGEHRRGEDVLGGADAREVERDVGAVQPVGATPRRSRG